jgi:hypothetical protein
VLLDPLDGATLAELGRPRRVKLSEVLGRWLILILLRLDILDADSLYHLGVLRHKLLLALDQFLSSLLLLKVDVLLLHENLAKLLSQIGVHRPIVLLAEALAQLLVRAFVLVTFGAQM